jgi:motility quorum-sensing regulator / GCU-specific mRNA interferase toxin
MEKRTPSCKLSTVKALIAQNKVRMTGTALAGAATLNLNATGILEVVSSLTSNDFYKSMTTHADHRIWQDVYRPNTSVGRVYLKLTVIEDVLIVSFKALEQ